MNGCGVPDLFPASSPLYYITALTALFESIAMIVDQHQPVVEKYYGRGKMRLVVQRLLEEADRVTKTLRTNWEEDRSIKRKVSAYQPFLHCIPERTTVNCSLVRS